MREVEGGVSGAELSVAPITPLRRNSIAAIRRSDLFVPIDDGSECCGQIGMGLDGSEFAGLDQRGDDGPVFRPGVVTGEDGVFAVQDHHPFILPMSAKSGKSTTVGILILARRSSCDGSSIVPLVSS